MRELRMTVELVENGRTVCTPQLIRLAVGEDVSATRVDRLFDLARQLSRLLERDLLQIANGIGDGNGAHTLRRL